MATSPDTEDHDLANPSPAAGHAEESAMQPTPADLGADSGEVSPPPASAVQVADKPTVQRPPPPRSRTGTTPPKRGSLGKTLILFVIIVGGLAAGFAVLSREEPAAPPIAKWNVGQEVDIDVTLVATDSKDLACAATDEIAGKHCGFETQAKKWHNEDTTDDKKLLRPYTTTDRIQFLAAGLWSDAGMTAAKLPASRFTAKCKLKVEGKVKKFAVRWNETGPWYDRTDEINAGSVSNCKLIP